MERIAVTDALHYCAEDGWFGDPMPLYARGIYHLYYTKLRKDTGLLSWGHISSRDMLHWDEHPDPITTDGGERGLCTGSVIYHEGKYWAFYAAALDDGVHRMFSAESEDGITFRKHRVSLLPEDRPGYRMDGTWRDPCVFWNEEEGCFWMLFCAKAPQGAAHTFPGVTGLAKSADLICWELYPPLWQPGMTTAPECPDVFRDGGRWGLVYYWHETRIRTAEKLGMPWKRARVQSPDRFDFMAGKQMHDGERRLLFGWVPRKACDCGERIWGGNAACPRELTLEADGTPRTRFFRELDTVFGRRAVLSAGDMTVGCGPWTGGGDRFDAGTEDAPAFASLPSAPDDYRLRFSMELQGEHAVGMWILRAESAESYGTWAEPVDEGYALLFDRADGMLRLRESYQWDQRPDLAVIPWQPGKDGRVDVDILLHGDILEVCLDNAGTMVYRMMKHPRGTLAVCVQDGTMRVRAMRMDLPTV